jgi:hypothetical protein
MKTNFFGQILYLLTIVRSFGYFSFGLRIKNDIWMIRLADFVVVRFIVGLIILHEILLHMYAGRATVAS